MPTPPPPPQHAHTWNIFMGYCYYLTAEIMQCELICTNKHTSWCMIICILYYLIYGDSALIVQQYLHKCIENVSINLYSANQTVICIYSTQNKLKNTCQPYEKNRLFYKFSWVVYILEPLIKFLDCYCKTQGHSEITVSTQYDTQETMVKRFVQCIRLTMLTGPRDNEAHATSPWQSSIPGFLSTQQSLQPNNPHVARFWLKVICFLLKSSFSALQNYSFITKSPSHLTDQDWDFTPLSVKIRQIQAWRSWQVEMSGVCGSKTYAVFILIG